MKKSLILGVIFSSLILNAYGVPRPMGSEGTILLLFGAVFLIVSGILFINSVLQRFLLDYKKYYKKVYWHSFIVLLSLFIQKLAGTDGAYDLYILCIIFLACLINFLIGNRSLYSSSDKENTDS